MWHIPNISNIPNIPKSEATKYFPESSCVRRAFVAVSFPQAHAPMTSAVVTGVSKESWGKSHRYRDDENDVSE